MENAECSSLCGCVRRTLSHLKLGVELRPVDCQSNGPEQKNSQGQDDEDERLAPLSLATTSRNPQNVITPWLVVFSCTSSIVLKYPTNGM